MAHDLNFQNGRASYTGRRAAWHQLGTVTGQHFAWQDVAKDGRLDYSVVKRQLEYNGVPVEAWGTWRTDNETFLGAVGSDYTVIQHTAGFEMLDALVSAKDGAHYETAGVLGKGETVWGLIDLNIALSVGADRSDNYLLFSTAHDGSKSHNYRMTSTRVVCQNTLGMALGRKAINQLTVRHTKNADNRIADMHTALEGIGSEVRTMEERLNFLAGRKVTREAATDVFDRLFPRAVDSEGKAKPDSTRRENMIAGILERFERNDGNAFPEQRGTAYNLLNGVTEWTDHYRDGVRGGKRSEAAMFGTGDSLKSLALEVITLAAGKMPAHEVKTVFVPTPVSTPSYSLLDEIVEAMG